MKATSLISAIVFIAITISAMALIYQTGMPIIQRMQSSAGLDQMTSAFSELDKTIERVASEGNGSRRIFDLNSGEGRLNINPSNDEIYWTLQAESSVLKARTGRYIGNVATGSNIEASLYTGTYDSQDVYILENDHLVIYIRKMDTPQSYTTDSLFLGSYQKDLKEWLPLDHLDISLDGETSSKSGTGYTQAISLGRNIPRAEVTAYMESIYGNYSVTFTLESGADFVLIEGESL